MNFTVFCKLLDQGIHEGTNGTSLETGNVGIWR